MKKLIKQGTETVGWTLIAIGNFTVWLIFLYAEWLLIRQSFINFINPFRQFMAMINTLLTPAFWIAVGVILIGVGIKAISDKILLPAEVTHINIEPKVVPAASTLKTIEGRATLDRIYDTDGALARPARIGVRRVNGQGKLPSD